MGLFSACPRRGTQVVRERSAKPLCVGSIPTRASKIPQQLTLKGLLDSLPFDDGLDLDRFPGLVLATDCAARCAFTNLPRPGILNSPFFGEEMPAVSKSWR